MKLPNPQKLTMPCFGAPSPSEQAHTLSGECKSENRSAMSDFATPWTGPWNSPGQNTGVGSLSLLQGIFPTQGLNLALPHCRWIFFFFFFFYQLSHKGSQINPLVLCCVVAQLYLTLCNPMGCNMPGFPVLHRLLEFSQTHVHWAGDTIQSPHLSLDSFCEETLRTSNSPGTMVDSVIFKLICKHTP